MARATQMLAYHGRTALLLGPMPRRAIPPVANSSAAIRPLVDVSDFARNSTLKAASGLASPVPNTLLGSTVLPSVAMSAAGRHSDASLALLLRVTGQSAKDGRS